MLSKNKIKYIQSLQLKKFRKEEQCFVVEGAKSVLELLNSDFEVQMVAGTSVFLNQLPATLSRQIELIESTEEELSKAGTFKTNDGALALARIKKNKAPHIHDKDLVLVLDDLRDPGNLGTIIRLCDWFGIKQIIASEETADCYNPKVISASMGSFCRVEIFYTNLESYLPQVKLPTFGTFMNGEDVHRIDFKSGGLIIIGNEANGISAAVTSLVKKKITIPRKGKAESLNAAMAAAIVLDVATQSK